MIDRTQELAKAFYQMGIAAQEATAAIKKVNDTFSRIARQDSEINTIKSRLNQQEYNTHDLYKITNELERQIKISEDRHSWEETEITSLKDTVHGLRYELDELRPVLDTRTDKPKQKCDLEIFSPIVWSEDFLKLCDGNIFLG